MNRLSTPYMLFSAALHLCIIYLAILSPLILYIYNGLLILGLIILTVGSLILPHVPKDQLLDAQRKLSEAPQYYWYLSTALKIMFIGINFTIMNQIGLIVLSINFILGFILIHQLYKQY